MRTWLRYSLITAAILLTVGADAFAQSNQVVFNEILIRQSGNSNVNQLVELRNTGSSPINIGGWWFCHEFNYISVPGGTTIPGGGYLTVHFNQSGIASASDIYFPGEALSFTSDLGLYINSSFGTPASMHAFIQFGGVPGSGRQSVAVQAGLWTNNAFVPNPPAGQSVEFCSDGGGDPTMVGSWGATLAPTIGAMNGCGVAVDEVSWAKVKSLFDPRQRGLRPF